MKVKQLVLYSKRYPFWLKEGMFCRTKQLVLFSKKAFQCEISCARVHIYPKENIVHPCTPCTQMAF